MTFDTIPVLKNTSIILKNVTLRFDKDTVLILPDTVFYQIEKGNFYRKLKDRWYQRKFTKQLFDLLFTLPSDDFKLDTANLVESENPFIPFQGKIIGEIEITNLEALGTRMDDLEKRPESVVQKLGNTVNFKTRNRVLSNNLLFEEGDILSPSTLSDNERILRELPFIKDARILVTPRSTGDTVDLMVLTKDVLSLSIEAEPRDFDGAVLGIDHRNIFGSGHRIDNKFRIDAGADQKFSYEVKYRVPNIKKTFTSLELRYANTENRNFGGVKVNRDFVTPKIKFAGGLEWNQQRVRQVQLSDIVSDADLTRDEILQKFDYQDVWLARAFPLRTRRSILRDRTRLIFSGRLSRVDYLIRPEVSLNENQIYHNRFLAIASIGFSQRRFFKDQLIFGYGRTEDIPYGVAVELLTGHEWGEFYNRDYFGLRLSQGNFLGNAGYLASSFLIESYLNGDGWEQGVVRADLRFFSALIDLNRWKFRQFITLNYTRGIDRFENEFIDIRDRNGIRGLRSNTLRGTQRFLINAETVSFTPLEVLQFRFAIFGFFDLGFINQDNEDIFDAETQYGFGLGLRIRNDNLTFKAIEIRFAYYPNAPLGIDNFDLDLSGNSGFRFSDFLIGRPQINNFN